MCLLPQPGYRTVPSPRGPLLVPSYNHIHSHLVLVLDSPLNPDNHLTILHFYNVISSILYKWNHTACFGTGFFHSA